MVFPIFLTAQNPSQQIFIFNSEQKSGKRGVLWRTLLFNFPEQTRSQSFPTRQASASLKRDANAIGYDLSKKTSQERFHKKIQRQKSKCFGQKIIFCRVYRKKSTWVQKNRARCFGRRETGISGKTNAAESLISKTAKKKLRSKVFRDRLVKRKSHGMNDRYNCQNLWWRPEWFQTQIRRQNQISVSRKLGFWKVLNRICNERT